MKGVHHGFIGLNAELFICNCLLVIENNSLDSTPQSISLPILFISNLIEGSLKQ